MKLNVIRLAETASTSAVLRDMLSDAPHSTVVTTRRQTAGRGQRGNSWESEPGKNLTFSVLVRPRHIMARDAFVISAAVANAIYDFTLRMRPGADVSVKWPNDIYFDNLKICGILIECQLTGRELQSAIAGIGINVNQLRFVSDAPNPVSLAQIIGCDTRLEPLLDDIAAALDAALTDYIAEPDPKRLLIAFHARLWRRDGLHLWRDKLTDEVIEASIINVAADGPITLRLADGTERTYSFKEIAAIITAPTSHAFERF